MECGLARVCTFNHRRTSPGGGGGRAREAAAAPATDFSGFLGQNAHDSGNDT